ncbi:MAG: hypothetical protein GX230_05295 [Lentisphaerae bacterium]|jgi:mitochondrial fission protein ELM1|nr:hypothetical protein [Lentisphaerota bacterium]
MPNAPLLIISDGKPGHVNQSRALCDALGRPFAVVEVAYRQRLFKALAYLADRCGMSFSSLYRVTSPLPEGPFAAVVCTGSTAFYPGKIFARRRKIPVAAILDPKGWRRDFDAILAPVFDNPKPAANLVKLPVNLTAVSPGFYENGVAAFRERHTWERAAVGVVIGGPSAFADMSAEFMRAHLDRIFAATEGLERWVTTSRRTPAEVEALVDSYSFDYKLIFSRDNFNPIPAFVSLCDTLFVTADSTSMISEAVTYGAAKVEVIMNLHKAASKFARLISNLESSGALHIFENELGYADKKVDLTAAFEATAALLKLDHTRKKQGGLS